MVSETGYPADLAHVSAISSEQKGDQQWHEVAFAYISCLR